MKSTDNNFINHLFNQQKPLNTKTDKFKGLSLFEGFSGLFKQLKNKLFSTASTSQTIEAIKDAINNKKAKLVNLGLGQTLKIAISIPGDGNCDTTHIIIAFTKTADDKFNVYNSTDMISENQTFEEIFGNSELMSNISKNNKAKKNSTIANTIELF